MKIIIKSLVLVLLLPALTACSWLFGEEGYFRDRGDDYRHAAMDPPLQIPERLSGDSIDDRFAIPPIKDQATLTETFVVPRPEPLDSNTEQDVVRINTLGDSRWILVNGSPGQVWPRLRGFFNLNQLGVQRADAASGILETAWLQPKGDGLLRERYRLRIEQGVQRGTSEVYVLQADISAGTDQWPQHSSNPKRENIMIEELAQYLADSASAAAVSMLAQQAIESSGRISLLETEGGQPYLKLSLPFPRAWASVGLALTKAGFTVDDLNRDQRVYYLHYVESKAEEKGFFSRLFSSDDADEGTPYLVYVKERDAGSVQITIQHQDDKPMEREQSLKLLKLIKRFLS